MMRLTALGMAEPGRPPSHRLPISIPDQGVPPRWNGSCEVICRCVAVVQGEGARASRLGPGVIRAKADWAEEAHGRLLSHRNGNRMKRVVIPGKLVYTPLLCCC